MAQGGISLENVSKVYGEDVLAVDGVDLEIGEGEFMVLVGPSGCGKSTLLRLIAGLEDATGGTIVIGGQDVTLMRPQDRDIAMVFQNYALYPHMTVEQNLAFGLRLHKVPKEERQRRVLDAARTLGLDRTCSTASLRRSRAVSASASRSAARWCASRSRS